MRGRVHRSRVTHDRWLVSYADFITLLFAFFVVLYAFARADQKKQREIPKAIDSAFSSMGVMAAQHGEKSNASSDHASPPLPVEIIMGQRALTPSMVKDDLTRIRRDLEQRLAEQVAGHSVSIQMGRDGLVISLREAGFFDSGSAVAHQGAEATLRKIAGSLEGTAYDVRIEGHTDNEPIHSAEFASNWELSSARATRVARLLLDVSSIQPQRVSAAGYAEYHPVDTNDTPQGRANNRRVDLVVMPRSAVDFAAASAPRDRAPWRRITDGE